jgi:hypothetical protein
MRVFGGSPVATPSEEGVNSRGPLAGFMTDNLCANKLRNCIQEDRHACWGSLGFSSQAYAVRSAISIRARIGSAGADEFAFSVVMYSVSSSIAEVKARGRGRYRGVLQPPSAAS